MKAKLNAELHVLVALLAFASAQASAAPSPYGKGQAITTAALTLSARDKDLHSRALSRVDVQDGGSPLALDHDPFALIEPRLDGPSHDGERVIRLYPIRGGEAAGEGAGASATAADTAKEKAQTVQAAKKAALPRPGSWALLLVGLLGAGAIARRRMSA